jgi:HPt (histidine-containing phosphotransfer) domain-containing protein
MKRLIESSMVNKSIVADLDEDILELALSIFIKNADKEILELTENYKEKNLTKVKSLAHKLRGSSITVGLKKISSIAQKIEEKPTEKDIKKLKTEFLLIKELVN